MRIKSYFAESMDAALNKARQELGPDAMLIDSRRVLADANQTGGYEISCAHPPAMADQTGTANEELAPQQQVRVPSWASNMETTLTRDLAELRRQFAVLHRSFNFLTWGRGSSASPNWADTCGSLMASEFCPTLAWEIVQALAASGKPLPTSPRLARSILVEELRSRVRADARLGKPGADRAIVAIIGAPGAGKTSTLVKLAASYGLAARLPVQIISMDTYRMGASETLKSYASILGVGFLALDTVGALAQALEEHRNKGLILIDTPGFPPSESDAAQDLAPYLARHAEIDVHLALPAYMKSSDMLKVTERYGAFHFSKLIFTKLDETWARGPMLSEAIRSGKPVSFLTTGQHIPEDLIEASVEELIDMVVEGKEMALSAA